MLNIFRIRKKAKKSIARKTSYEAVQILCDTEHACEQALIISQHIYLRVRAPLIPLPLCTNRYYCRCTYKHYPDRRRGLRREADVGLPVHFSGSERRRIGDRRAY